MDGRLVVGTMSVDEHGKGEGPTFSRIHGVKGEVVFRVDREKVGLEAVRNGKVVDYVHINQAGSKAIEWQGVLHYPMIV